MPKIERSLPPYMQLVVHLRSQVESGELQAGDLVPGDRELSAQWGVSKATAQKALTALRAEGVLESISGVGTRVRELPAPRHFAGRDRAASVRGTGRIYNEGEYARIVSAELVPAPEDVATVLNIAAGTPAIKRVRVTFSASDQPVSTSTSWFDGAHADAAPKLLQSERIIEGTWAYLEEQVGISAAQGQDRISTRLATEEEGELLGIQLPAAVKVGRTILRGEDSSVVEYGVSISGAGRESVYDYDVS